MILRFPDADTIAVELQKGLKSFQENKQVSTDVVVKIAKSRFANQSMDETAIREASRTVIGGYLITQKKFKTFDVSIWGALKELLADTLIQCAKEHSSNNALT